MIFNNTAVGNGGGIANNGSVTDENSVIYENSAGLNGGGYSQAAAGASAVLSGTQFGVQAMPNTAAVSAGGVYVGDGDFTMTGGGIMYNTSAQDGGLGCGFPGSTAYVVLYGVGVGMNQGTNNAGGIGVTDCTFIMHGGGIGMNTTNGSGGGLYNTLGYVRLDQGVTVANNTAVIGDGGGLYLTGGNTTTALNTVTITGNTVPGGQGAGIYQQIGGLLLQTNVTNPDGQVSGP